MIRSLSTVVLGLSVWIGSLAFAAPAPAAHPLDTAIVAGNPYYGPDADLALQRTRAAGATAIRLQLSWREVSPQGTRPPGFDPSNPSDPSYDWVAFDRLVERAVKNGLEPFVSIDTAPSWAETVIGGRAGANRPDPAELGRFAGAAASRYSGNFGGLPRVGTWEVWNEPNASFFLFPQTGSSSPNHYRLMVNAVARAVHGVHAGNRVVAGAQFPFALDRPGVRAIGPLSFMRRLLCLSRRLRVLTDCGEPLQADTWSHHPYTSGGPTHRVSNAASVSIRELPRMRRVLRAGLRLGRVVHAHPVRFWVTEFSWDSRPPDPKGVPSRLHARWTAEAFYRMWRSGVSLVTWFQLRDEAANGRPHPAVFESGLYRRCEGGLRCDKPKRALRAFQFPFVAFRTGGRHARVWGRTPSGRRATVIVEQAAGGGWRRLAKLRSDKHGIFTRTLRTSAGGPLRARNASSGKTALPFSLRRPPDRAVNPFG